MTTHASTPSARARAGFTLIEVLITALVIGSAFVAATWSMSATARTKMAYDKAATPAGFLAQEIFTLADGLPRTPSGMPGATNGSPIMALDALIGASFSPPLLADGSEAPGYEGWKQDIDLSVYAVSDLSSPCGLDPIDGLPPESGFVYRLDVLVSHDGEEVGAFSWWIRP